MRKLILVLLAGCVACSSGAQAPRPSTQKAPESDTLARIHTLVGTPSCTEDAQCHSLALGTRPCGGPESYLPWSSASTPAAELQALGERYKEERRAANAASGRMSTCQYLMDPGAVCRAGTCEAGKIVLQAR